MKKPLRLLAASLLLVAGATGLNWLDLGWTCGAVHAADTAGDDIDSQLEVYADLPGPMLRGLTISKKGRVFVTFPRMAGNSSFTLAELKDGKPVPYPSLEMNQPDQAKASEQIFSVMSAVVDNKDRLWLPADTSRASVKLPSLVAQNWSASIWPLTK